MTFEEAHEFLNGTEDGSDGDYLTAEGTRTENFIKGLQILAKYSTDVVQGSNHDILYLCEHPNEMPKEEIKELSRLGFHLDSDNEGWSKFT